jgi:hypothetical protein
VTFRIVEQSASTASQDSPPPAGSNAEASTTPTQELAGFMRPGPFFAGVVLAAALTVVGPSPAIATPEFLLRRRYGSLAESGTEALEVDRHLLAEVRQLFEQGATEFFQDGTQSRFSVEFLRLLAERGVDAIVAVSDYLFSGQANPDVSSEALRWLAELSDPATLPNRWAIFERSLRDASPRVRDGAIVGFASLDDSRAVAALLEAREHEHITELRRLIDQVVAQLQSSHGSTAADRPGKPLA